MSLSVDLRGGDLLPPDHFLTIARRIEEYMGGTFTEQKQLHGTKQVMGGSRDPIFNY